MARVLFVILVCLSGQFLLSDSMLIPCQRRNRQAGNETEDITSRPQAKQSGSWMFFDYGTPSDQELNIGPPMEVLPWATVPMNASFSVKASGYIEGRINWWYFARHKYVFANCGTCHAALINESTMIRSEACPENMWINPDDYSLEFHRVHPRNQGNIFLNDMPLIFIFPINKPDVSMKVYRSMFDDISLRSFEEEVMDDFFEIDGTYVFNIQLINYYGSDIIHAIYVDGEVLKKPTSIPSCKYTVTMLQKPNNDELIRNITLNLTIVSLDESWVGREIYGMFVTKSEMPGWYARYTTKQVRIRLLPTPPAEISVLYGQNDLGFEREIHKEARFKIISANQQVAGRPSVAPSTTLSPGILALCALFTSAV